MCKPAPDKRGGNFKETSWTDEAITDMVSQQDFLDYNSQELSLELVPSLGGLATSPFPCLLCLISQSCLTLCDPVDCSPPGSSAHWILQTRILELIVMFSSRESSQPRDRTQVSYIAGRFFTS